MASRGPRALEPGSPGGGSADGIGAVGVRRGGGRQQQAQLTCPATRQAGIVAVQHEIREERAQIMNRQHGERGQARSLQRRRIGRLRQAGQLGR